jgi:hypothetical protein
VADRTTTLYNRSMAKPPEPLHVVFTDDDLGEIVEHMDRLERLGHGWINLDPLLDLDDIPPPPSGLSGLFSAKGPPIPRATWIAPNRRRRRAEPATIGMEHGRGRRALPFLADEEVYRDPSWRTLSDAPKRGLVIALPPGADNAEVLSWLIRAGTALSTVPLGGRWRGSVYDG